MRIIRTTSTRSVSKQVRVKLPTKTGCVIRSVPIKVVVKTTVRKVVIR